MSLSYAETVDLECPQCQTSFQAEIWLIIDANERPDLAAQCKAGDVHVVSCPNAHMGVVGAPLLYHDPEQSRLILAVPQGLPDERINEVNQELVGQLWQSMENPDTREYMHETTVVPIQTLAMYLSDPSGFHLESEVHGGDSETDSESDTEASSESPLFQSLRQFIEAETWGESKEVVAANPELLSEDADHLLSELIEMAHQKEDAHSEQVFTDHRNLLAQVRTEGIDAAFAPRLVPPVEDADLTAE